MRRDELYLRDILDAADAIGRFVAGMPEERFAGAEIVQSAVLQKLTVIGEAAARVSAAFRRQHPQIPWTEIAAFRNIAVHAYFSVNWSIVWTTATGDVPALRRQIARIVTGLPNVADEDENQ